MDRSFEFVKSLKDEKVVIKDVTGQKFWEKAFQHKETVGWGEFLTEFFLFFGGRYTPPTDGKKEREEIVFLQYALQAMTGRVHMNHFGAFLTWFGPLPNNPEKMYLYKTDDLEKLLKSVHKQLTRKWFGGFMHKEEVEKHLKEFNKKGSFIVTFEPTQPGNYKLSATNKEGEIIHEKIVHLPGSTHRIGMYEYQTLHDLVEHKDVKKKMNLKTPCKPASINEVINKVNTPSVMRLRMIEEEECSTDHLYDLPPDFDVDLELKKLKERFIRENFNSQGIKIRAVPVNPNIVAGANRNALLVLYEIQADTEENKRNPFDLAVVLDKSGSMRGAPLMYSLQAVGNIVDVMSSSDRIHFVVYDNEPTVIIENGTIRQRESMLDKINKVEAGGGTNIEAGLETAMKLLMKSSSDGIQRSRRIFLFSDGVPTLGKKTETQLAELSAQYRSEHSFLTSSYGIGVEFDEKMMSAISDAGGGQYFYIDKPEKILDLVKEGVEGLIDSIGTDAALEIECAPGIARVNGIYGNQTHVTENGITIGDLRKRDFIQILVELDIDPSLQRPNTTINVANFHLTYNTPMGPVNFSHPLILSFVDKRDEAKCLPENDDVYVVNHLRLSIDADEQVAAYVMDSDFLSAVNLKRTAMRILQKATERDRRGVTRIPMLKAQKLFSEVKQMRWDSTIQASVIKHIHYNGYISKQFNR